MKEFQVFFYKYGDVMVSKSDEDYATLYEEPESAARAVFFLLMDSDLELHAKCRRNYFIENNQIDGVEYIIHGPEEITQRIRNGYKGNFCDNEKAFYKALTIIYQMELH